MLEYQLQILPVGQMTKFIDLSFEKVNCTYLYIFIYIIMFKHSLRDMN